MSLDPARLTAVPLFAALTDDERAAVAAKLEERTANAGDHLSTEGGAGYFFFVIESGGATVTRDGQTLAEFGPGDFFGEAAIFKTRRRTATVTATAPTKLFAMFGADFAKLVADIPELHTEIDDALAARLPD
jgi:CRP-like cAMP-binding protein